MPGIVVRTPVDRRIPFNPRALMARSTDPGEASGRVRWISAVIFLRPYKPSGVRRRTPALGPSASTVHTASRTMSITTASPAVRSATRCPALAQAR